MTGYQQNGPRHGDRQANIYGHATNVNRSPSQDTPITHPNKRESPHTGAQPHNPYPAYGHGNRQNGPWQPSGQPTPYGNRPTNYTRPNYNQPNYAHADCASNGIGTYWHAPAPVPRRSGISGGGIAAIITAALIIPALLFMLIVAGVTAFSHGDDYTATTNSTASAQTPQHQRTDEETEDDARSAPAPTYRMDERPGYNDLVDYIDGKLSQYKKDILGDITMFMSQHRIPDTQEGNDYMTGFVAALLGISNNIKEDAATSSEDPSALDEKIEQYRTTIDTLETRFQKGEALGLTMTVTGNDGKQYSVDGNKSITLTPTWDEYEKQVASSPNNLGNGNAASAQKLVERAGMTLNWNIDKGFRHCPSFVGTDNGSNKALSKSETFGFYCPSTPNVIYGNKSMPDWNMTYAPAAGVRHEISHHAIHMRCGSIEPPAVMQGGVNRAEGVTNSYAVRYMGADRALIQQSIDYARANGHNQYTMDAFTDHAADLIHSGQCQTN